MVVRFSHGKLNILCCLCKETFSAWGSGALAESVALASRASAAVRLVACVRVLFGRETGKQEALRK